MKFITLKKVPGEDFDTIPPATICETRPIDGIPVIIYKGKNVCDIDSEMAKEYFKRVISK